MDVGCTAVEALGIPVVGRSLARRTEAMWEEERGGSSNESNKRRRRRVRDSTCPATRSRRRTELMGVLCVLSGIPVESAVARELKRPGGDVLSDYRDILDLWTLWRSSGVVTVESERI